MSYLGSAELRTESTCNRRKPAMLVYVLVKVQPGKESGVARETVKIEGITEAMWTYGFCDILFKVNVRSVEELNKVVLRKIRMIPGVRSTETIIVSPIPIYGSRPSAKFSRKTHTKSKFSRR
jgi:DNA-binding Lrp family transcriptional regulator